ncbi:MAG TPA: hypothetical protein PLB31_01785 [Fimbriimonadaceae bacterium]|nr:hypothetical protein [Armatimonadota bacterium]HCM74230.1 hypothetical protein [Armatimonadota bacterium]HRD31496.1 hypothetical protein [Fimbriimonadaceae bacterium]HRE94334.1 hypothetical protein [Fimbriimonadaceae bacterium]HRI73184.1 hypothetical protein [Fimbriimonadaceae bacterium]
MALEPAVGDRYYITYEALGKPQAPRDVFVPGLGTVYLDDADIYYAKRTAGAAFYIRKSKALGDNYFVTVSRVQPG